MATLTIPAFNLPVGITAQDVVDASAKEWGYLELIPDSQNPTQLIANPMTKSAFVKQYLGRLLMSNYRSQRAATTITTALGTLPVVGDPT